MIPNPEDWSTPRYWYNNSNMLAPLPATLDNEGRADTLLFLSVADDLDAHAEHLDSLQLRLLLSDPPAEAPLAGDRLERTAVRAANSPGGLLWNKPPATDVEERIEVRVNNILLTEPTAEGGWLVFRDVPPRALAVGKNLIGVRVTRRPLGARAHMQIEKVELHVRYRATHSA